MVKLLVAVEVRGIKGVEDGGQRQVSGGAGREAKERQWLEQKLATVGTETDWQV